MTTTDDATSQEKEKKPRTRNEGASHAVYGLGFLGALVYYLLHAATFWEGLVGVLKAILWPAMLVYNLFEFLKM